MERLLGAFVALIIAGVLFMGITSLVALNDGRVLSAVQAFHGTAAMRRPANQRSK